VTVAEPVTEPVTEAIAAPKVAVAAKPAKPAAATRAKAKPAAKPARVAAAAAAGKTATLMIGSKPPCDIILDGKRTGLITPQRALKVTPGPHRVMLANDQHKIYLTFSVVAVEGQSVKLIQDLTSKMKR